MSSASRVSTQDRRANGPPASSDKQRPRVNDSKLGSFSRHDISDLRRTTSPQSDDPYGSSHRRTASGNPRPLSRTHEDRRIEERRTEKKYITQLESIVHRTRSPERSERRQVPTDKVRVAAEKPRSSEARPKEPKVEIPQGNAASPNSSSNSSVMPMVLCY